MKLTKSYCNSRLRLKISDSFPKISMLYNRTNVLRRSFLDSKLLRQRFELTILALAIEVSRKIQFFAKIDSNARKMTEDIEERDILGVYDLKLHLRIAQNDLKEVKYNLSDCVEKLKGMLTEIQQIVSKIMFTNEINAAI